MVGHPPLECGISYLRVGAFLVMFLLSAWTIGMQQARSLQAWRLQCLIYIRRWELCR